MHMHKWGYTWIGNKQKKIYIKNNIHGGKHTKGNIQRETYMRRYIEGDIHE